MQIVKMSRVQFHLSKVGVGRDATCTLVVDESLFRGSTDDNLQIMKVSHLPHQKVTGKEELRGWVQCNSERKMREVEIRAQLRQPCYDF